MRNRFVTSLSIICSVCFILLQIANISNKRFNGKMYIHIVLIDFLLKNSLKEVMRYLYMVCIISCILGIL